MAAYQNGVSKRVRGYGDSGKDESKKRNYKS
jgi:hypothetical protein